MNGDHFAVDTSQMSNDTVNFSRLTNTGEECALPGATRYLAGFYKTATEQVSFYFLPSSQVNLDNLVKFYDLNDFYYLRLVAKLGAFKNLLTCYTYI